MEYSHSMKEGQFLSQLMYMCTSTYKDVKNDGRYCQMEFICNWEIRHWLQCSRGVSITCINPGSSHIAGQKGASCVCYASPTGPNSLLVFHFGNYLVQ